MQFTTSNQDKFRHGHSIWVLSDVAKIFRRYFKAAIHDPTKPDTTWPQHVD